MNNSLDHHRKIARVNRQSSSSSRNTIPNDLIIEILLRLTSKTIAICRCVSKQWNSFLGTPYFTESFLIRSSARPRILFTFEVGDKWHICSSPQPQNLDKELTHVAADYHMSLSRHSHRENCQSVNGFICLIDKGMLTKKRDAARVPVLCNPSTGQHVTLPKVKARNNDLRSFFGYDPVNKQYKVLCMTVTNYRQVNSREHQVLTLGKGKKLSWRKIECSFPHYPDDNSDGICINGVLYYMARSVHDYTRLIACFDVRSEEFSLLNMPVSEFRSLPFSALVNYKGKLGAVNFNGSHGELWVLESAEKEKWSKHVFVMPDKGFHHTIKSTWATDRDEIAWVRTLKSSLCVYYSNLETKSVRRVMIQGIDEQALMAIHRCEAQITVRDHVENVMFL
ncbi:unnamed protein product [Microthlaspi erraticum]|uniref:F-box domain-containing protein n=1 Tax=Microthlaspi erraticum TaxID=1685480 RepID=A0A6D2K885_9BRAS|nr:unnamed protein product [Microthlaspi erraticum]